MALFHHQDEDEQEWENIPNGKAYYSDPDFENEDDYELEDDESRRDRLRVAAGLFNFAAVIVGMVVVLIMIALLVSLISWLQSDLSRSFSLIQSGF